MPTRFKVPTAVKVCNFLEVALFLLGLAWSRFVVEVIVNLEVVMLQAHRWNSFSASLLMLLLITKTEGTNGTEVTDNAGMS
jgi:hypothetical protein